MADNTIDTLVLEINSNAKGAEKALDNLANSLFELSSNLNLVNTSKINQLSNSFTEMAGSAIDFSKALKSIDFSNLAGNKNALSKIIDQATINLMKELGIRGKQSFNEIRDGLLNIDHAWDSAKKIIEGMSKDIKESAFGQALIEKTGNDIDAAYSKLNTTIAHTANGFNEMSEAFRPLVEYINAINRSGNKISIPFPKEFGEEYSRMRSTLGKAFTSQKGGTDFEIFINELNSELGNLIDTTHGAEAAFEDLYNKLRKGRGIADEIFSSQISSEDINKVVGDAYELIQDFKENAKISGDDIGDSNESSELGNLKKAVQEVTEAVKGKTRAFQNEGTSVSTALEKEISKLITLKTTMESIGSSSGDLKGFDSFKEILKFDPQRIVDLANGIAKLGRGTVTQASKNIPELTKYLKELFDSIKDFQTDSLDLSVLSEFTASIQKLGGKSATKAAETNIVSLAKALKEMMNILSNAPRVSANVLQMTQSLAQLASAGGKAGTASRALSNGFNILPASTSKAKKGFSGLASAIGKFYATYWLLIRAMGGFKKAIDISSDLTETQNVVDVTFGDMADTINEFAASALKNLGMSELMAKKIASRFQAMGVAMGFPREEMSEMSIELTKLAGDMASFYNESQESVAKALQSVFTGETEPLRKWGLDLSFATVEAWALSQGLDASMQSMTQAEKTMLRYQYIMANTGAASGSVLLA